MTMPRLNPAGDGRFRVTWTEDGKRHQRTFTNLGDARRFQTVQTYLTVRPQPAPMPVSELVRQWAQGRPVAKATAARIESTRQRLLEPYFGSQAAAQLTPQHIAEWVRWLREHHDYSPATIRSHFCVLRAAMRWAVNAEIISRSPCDVVALPRVPHRQRISALTRMPRPRPVTVPTGAHHHACGPLNDLRRALTSTAGVGELTELLRHLDLPAD